MATNKHDYHCQNCTWSGPLSKVNADIEDIFQRVGAGEVVPAGECPKCKCLVHGPFDPSTIDRVLKSLKREGWAFQKPADRVVLDQQAYPGDWDRLDSETFDQFLMRTDEMFDAIDSGKKISFPIADGYAHYFIIDTGPVMRLQHIPYGDAYRASPETLNGLTASSIRPRLKRTPSLNVIRLSGANKPC